MKKRLLVIDDDQSVRRVLRRFLERTGYEVIEAGDGAGALELVRERLRIGAASGYEFVFAEVAGEAAGYACFFPNTSARMIPRTRKWAIP